MKLPAFGGRLRGTAVLALLPLLTLTACGSGDTGGTAAVGAQASPAPTTDPVASVRTVDSVAALLPADVRRSGTLRVGSSIGFPPGAYYPNGSDKAPAGQDIDLADAVAKVLGVRLRRQDASFETILPALGSGKYDVGTGNFGVTTERLKTIDFVTYVNDGQGFAVKKGNTAIEKVTDLTQLCGLTVGTGAGTTFETTLTAQKDECAKAGKKPYDVKVYSENAATLTALQQGRIDVIMSTINGLRYQASQPASQTTFLGEYHRLDVGFAFKKGSPLTKAFRAAVDELIKDGTYARILRKWGTSASAIETSRINPPEHA
ncbi:putative ABC transporter substrate-binding protein [Streptomyces ambofaciens ATCC 23877]|uniref:ABC transporter substrate-binding protein n=2 Tax=Streptomyces ambofaciens TaxID=1889 RepID=A0ABM6B939_STRAM|nr:ABC transporter substrate-binding protein [Streptomyces ambofaciens]AKZ60234.1 putative ABC transporter substrate-binding protein [Streptomyces ambofaciens ATCC 23877]ANB10441.1 ABC transporter substrate-binding protein [Streptomyces ambofaciens]CAJ88114.1 putative ABC transporter substrate-binding protein [Streptomyces ambofaciens ATCC 23877]